MTKPPRILDLAFAVRGLPGPVMHLLIIMAKLGNSSGEVFASQGTLAAMCGYSDRTVRRCLTRLCKVHFITRVPNPGRTTTRYRLNFGRWGRKPGSGGQGGGPASPASVGHADRQNPEPNQEENPSPTLCRSSPSEHESSWDWAAEISDPALIRIGVAKGFLPASAQNGQLP